MGLKEGQLSDRGKLQCDLGLLLFSEDRYLFLATVLCLCGVEAGPGRHQHPRRGPGSHRRYPAEQALKHHAEPSSLSQVPAANHDRRLVHGESSEASLARHSPGS